MNQQIESIGIYADTIGIKDSADWELKVRRAVEENSVEYKKEMEARKAYENLIEQPEEEIEETIVKKPIKKQNVCSVPKNDWQTFLLVLIAFLLFLNLIFNKQ